MKKLILKNWRDIKSRKAQFGALIILVALGILSYVSFVSAYLNLSASTEFAYEKLKFADFSTKVISAPKRVVDKIQAIPGVEAVQGRLIIDTGLYISDEEQVRARIISIPPNWHPEVNDILIEEGSYLKGKAKDVCLRERHYADEREIELGDTLKPLVDGEKKEVIVEGIVVNPEYFNAVARKAEIPSPGELAIIFMAQSEVERMFQKPPSYNDIAVLLDKGANREEVIEKVEDILDPYLVIETVKREDQPSNFSIQEEIRQNQSMAYTMPFVILFVASISLFIALSRVVQSQRGEIGLAKALGYRNWQVLLRYLLFSLFIAFWGSVLGFALGTYFAKEIVELYAEIMGIPFLKHRLHPELIIGAISMSAIACILAGILPAYASARMRPATAMRADPNIALAKGRVPLIERAFTKILPISLTLRIPIRNIFRTRRRSFYTVVGIAFALLLTTSTVAMFDSTNYLLDSMFYEVENWDMVAGFSQNFSHRQIIQVKSWKGVKRVQPALLILAELKANGKKHETAITAMEPGANFHGFDISEGPEAGTALKRGGVILAPVIADKLGLEVGDSLRIETPYIKDREVTFKLLALSEEMLGAPVFIGVEQGRKLLRTPSVYNSLYLDVDPREAQEIKKKLYELPGATSVMIKQNLIDQLEEMMEFAYVFYGIMLAFAFTVAFVVVYTIFTANVLERLREIATMRTIGEDWWHLALAITLENLLLALVGIPLGLWLGVRNTSALFEAMSTEVYTLKGVMYTQSYFWVVGSVLIVLLLSEIPPIRKIFRLDLAQATKIIE